MRITLLGTGLMGAGFARGLLARGHDVTVWNRTAAKAEPLAADGARVAPEPASAARDAERLYLSLSDDDAVDASLHAALSGLPPEAIIVDFTTTAPLPTRERAARLARAGRPFLHAPVFMGPENARKAEGLMLGAGPEEVHARVAAELAAMTGTFWYLGADPGRAAAFKLFGNAMFFAVVAGLSDVFAVGRAAGIAPADVLTLFGKLNPARQIEFRGGKMARGDYAATFELAMARKDVRLMLETAAAGLPDAPLAILPAIAARMDAVIAEGKGGEDLGVIVADVLAAAAKG
jgi:3-hydroxyisobutyrate dehydrogenase-like beta-hydroxyacid dehydrogenase